MSNFSLQHYWTFGSRSLARVVDGGAWQTWFPESFVVDVQPILDSGGKRYVDRADTSTVGSLVLRVAFMTRAEQQTMQGLRGSVAKLTNVAGKSADAILVRADETTSAMGIYELELEFVRL